MHYVDGQGWQSGSLRSANYCPHCRQNPPLSPSSLPTSATPQQQESRHPPAASTVSLRDSFVAPPVASSVLASHSPRITSRPEPPRKSCGHDYCILSIPTCCACSDHQPHTATYPLYIDGQGNTSAGTRSSMYCSPCRDFHNPSRPTTTHEPGRHSAFPAMSERQRSILIRTFWGTIAEAEMNPNYVSPPEQISSVAVRTHEDESEPAYDTSEHDNSTPCPPLVQSLAPSRADVRGSRADSAEDLCKICFETPPDALLLPCAHLVTCAACAVLILTHNAPSPDPQHDEISGQDLIRYVERFIPKRTGKLGYAALTDIMRRAGGRGGEKAVCPICRDAVEHWIRVYRT
jgi:Zinc finger, C3HC4 type (RING finger)